MTCTRCGKSMDKAEGWVGGYPFGPKCFAKAFGKAYKPHSQVVADDKTPDMFSEVVEEKQDNG